MDNNLNNNIQSKNANWNISGFDINGKKSEIIEDLNIPNYKDWIDLIFEQNPELLITIAKNILPNKSIYDKHINQTNQNTEFISLYRAEWSTVDKEKLPIAIRGNAGSWFSPNIQECIRYKKMNPDRKLYKVDIPKTLYENIYKTKLVREVSKWEIQLPENISKLKIDIEIMAKQLYTEYLTTIFPESKIRNIAYHGTSSIFEGEDFDKSKLWSSTDNITNKLWFYFVPDKKVADIFIKWRKYKRENGKIKVILPENAKTLYVLLNIKNPEYIEWDVFQEHAETNKMPPLELNGDSIIITPQTKNILPEFSCENYVVFSPKQIHILWSENDIKQLKEWINKK